MITISNKINTQVDTDSHTLACSAQGGSTVWSLCLFSQLMKLILGRVETTTVLMLHAQQTVEAILLMCNGIDNAMRIQYYVVYSIVVEK